MLDLAAGTEVVERAPVAQPDELRARHDSHERSSGIARDRDPLAVLAQPVLGVGLAPPPRRSRAASTASSSRSTSDSPGSVEQREAHEQRRVGSLLVDAALRQLVLRERRAAARAPLGRAVAQVEPAALVHELQEPPDVLDVRVGEREVVVPPVHPLAEPLRAARSAPRRPDDLLAAAPRELREPVLLDLALRVEPELALDADLDPEPLAVEAVLVALVEARASPCSAGRRPSASAPTRCARREPSCSP